MTDKKPHYIAKAINRDGKLVGYKLYTKNGLFGCLTFAQYFWV